MRRLTNTQLDHLTNRIESVLHQLQSNEIAKLNKKPDLIEYTEEQKLNFIRKGKATIKRTENNGYPVQITSFFDYPKTPAMRNIDRLRDEHDRKVKQIQEKYKAERTKLLDTAILGDSTEALTLLQSLEAKL